MNAFRNSIERSRPTYAFAAALTIGAGLLWRSRLLPLPDCPAKYGGDSLWALVVFWGLGFAFRRSTTTRIALGTVSIAWCVELLQLYHAPWIDCVRSTRLGHLVLGSSFNGPDLLAYVVGAAIGALVEFTYHNARQKTD
jgi:hypothetical protein